MPLRRLALSCLSCLSCLTVCALLAAPTAAGAGEALVSEQLARCGEAAVGEEAPWLAGWTLDEQVFNIAKPFAGDDVERLVLVFWATWCQPCRRGLVELAANADRLDAAGAHVALVNVGEDNATVAGFLDKTPLPFEVVLDPYRNSVDTYLLRPDGRTALPLTVVLDRDRTVRRVIGAEGHDYVDLILEDSAP